jgi:hypothetical protein
MLPDRDVEFVIDLLPGTAPISKRPYRMSSTQLIELKKRLKNYWKRGLSVLVHHLGGHQLSL